MHLDPDRWDIDETTQQRVAEFTTLFWHSAELCNQCFTRIREIERLDVSGLRSDQNRPSSYHERTANAVNEWAPSDRPTARYGKTYCTRCGSESGGRWETNQSLADLRPIARRILEHTKRETDYDLDGATFGAAIRDLKTGPDARDRQGRDAQLLAVAWARSVETDTPTDDAAPDDDRASHERNV